MRYFITDAAADPEIHALVTATPDHQCLFAGALTPSLARNAPYIVTLDTAAMLFDRWKRRGIGKNWGVFFGSQYSMGDLRRDLRRSLQARLPDGRIVLFRFYDPRVWRSYMRFCDPADLVRWFGSIDVFYAENESGSGLWAYRFDGAELSVSSADLAALDPDA